MTPGGYIALDLETTGLSAEFDRVVEVGAVRFDADGEERGRYARLVHPCRSMPSRAQAVHGITDADLADAAAAGVVLPEFLDFLGDPAGSTLLAHNAWFDAGFLGCELARSGRDGPTPGLVIVDTLALARRKLPGLPSHRLDRLAVALGLDPGGPHRALADAVRVKGLWLALGGPGEEAGSLVAYPVMASSRPSAAPVGWDAIAGAIEGKRAVRMGYAGGTRGDGAREVTPRRFRQSGGVAYLVALCHLDSSEKSFRLDRVRWFEVLT